MAEQVQIAGTPEEGKLRNPLGVIGLTLITLGIYYWVWYYKVNKEMAAIGRANGTEAAGTSPGTSLLATTLGAFVIVPFYVSVYNSAKRLNAAEGLTGAPKGMDPALMLLLMALVGPIGVYFFQTNLNNTLQAQAQLGAGGVPSGIKASPA